MINLRTRGYARGYEAIATRSLRNLLILASLAIETLHLQLNSVSVAVAYGLDASLPE